MPVAKVGQHLAAAALDERAGPYQWLHVHYAEIAPVFAARKRPSWKALSKIAADSGLAYAPDTLRKAWKSLTADLEKAAVQLPRPSSLPHPRIRREPVFTEPDDPDDEGPPLPDFSKPVRG
jgi:hypothetical protein